MSKEGTLDYSNSLTQYHLDRSEAFCLKLFYKQEALRAFLDLEWAFDNTPFEICNALANVF